MQKFVESTCYKYKNVSPVQTDPAVQIQDLAVQSADAVNVEQTAMSVEEIVVVTMRAML